MGAATCGLVRDLPCLGAGFLLGSRETLLETKDGGRSWTPRTVAAAQDEGFNYRFTSVSFAGNEGWIVGKPAILLHSNDGGANWDRVPLSAKLPGNPILVSALAGKPGQAEMVTDAVRSQAIGFVSGLGTPGTLTWCQTMQSFQVRALGLAGA